MTTDNFVAERQPNGGVWIESCKYQGANIIAIPKEHCAALAELLWPDSLSGLQYALQIVKGRRILNRPPAYLVALDEIEIFLEAAIERVNRGESMHAVNVVRESCYETDYSRCAGEPE